MKRLLVAAGVLLVLAALTLAATPLWAPIGLGWKGITVAHARWCGAQLCFEDVTIGGTHAEGVRVGADRVAVVTGVALSLGGAVDAAKGGGSGTLDLLKRVDVERLTVSGAPLPPLAGQVWPERHLTGDGVTVDGDTVRATLPTPFGAADVELTPAEGGADIVARCAACTLPAPGDADQPLPLPPVTARGRWDDGAFTGTVRVDTVTADVHATRGDDALHATVTLPTTAIADLYALFRPWVPEVERARIGGTFAGGLELAWPGGVVSFTPSPSQFTVEGLVGEGLASGAFTFRGRGADGAETVFHSGEGTPNWTPLARMGVWLPAAVIAAEDAGFKAHPGYDLEGIRAAFAANSAEGDIVRGGSTLTQQLAKNLFLDGTRSYARKLRELLYAVDLDRTLGKPRVLELYLNVVEFGPGLRGARAAAQTYFLKEPEGLLPEEAAWLASILRQPRTAWERQYRADRVDEARVRWILENLRDVPEEPRQAALGRTVHLVPM